MHLVLLKTCTISNHVIMTLMTSSSQAPKMNHKNSHESGSYSFCTRSVLKSCNSIVCYEESYILFKYPPCWPIWMCKPTWMIFENCSSHKDIIWLQMTNITLYGLHFMHLKAPSHRSFSLYRRKQCECCAKQLKVWNNVRRIKWWQNDWTILLFY